MVSPAVAAPSATPGSEGNGTPPAPAENEPNPGSGAPPQGDPKPENQPEPGKSGKEPAGGGDPNPAPGSGDEPSSQPPQEQQPAASKPPEPRRLTPEEWAREQAAITRQNEQRELDKKAKDLIEKAPVMARDAIDTLAEELDVRIPNDLRQPLLTLIDELTTTGNRGAELKYTEELNDLQETLKETSLAFYEAMPDAATRAKFADEVRGKDAATWVKTHDKLIEPVHAAKALEKAAAAQAKLLPEGEVRDGFTAKVKGETDPEKIARAFHDSLLGVVGPGGEPRVAARGNSGRPTLAEVTRRRANGEYKTDKEFLEAQDAALQGL